uniref:HAD family hydrolase n=1 Tax=uncultured Dysgonomonas sp. TaxID=206096 RepID=UPI00262597E3
KKDTLFDFIKFYVGGKKLFKGLIILFPILMLYKLGFTTNDVAKQKLFACFFKNRSIEVFNKVSEDYIRRIQEIARPEIINKIKWHQSQNHTVVIISASISNWIKPWAKAMGIEKVLATEIDTIDDLIVGTFSTANCYGQEKINRLLAEFPDKSEYVLYAYGDSAGDKELLALSDYPTFIR